MRAGGRAFRRNALLLWIAQLISITGDALFMPCIGWLAAEVSGAPVSVGLAMAVAAVPFLLFGPLAGAWVDRADRRRVMIVSDLLRAALLLGFPLWIALSGGLSLALLLGVAFALGSFSTPFVPARDALLPQLVGARSLARWNATFQSSAYAASILGLALGGALLAMQGEGRATVDRIVTVLVIDGGTFVLSAGALALMVLPRTRHVRTKGRRLWAEVAEGLRYARRDEVVGPLLLVTALNNLALMGPAFVAPIVLFREDLRLGPEHLAWFEGAMAAGMLVGATVLARFGRRWPLGRLLLWSLVLDGLTYLPFLVLESYPLCVATIALHGLFIPGIVVARTTLVQAHVPDARRGKVFSLVHVTVTGMTAISCLGAGFVAEAFGARVLFAVAGIFATLCGIVGLRTIAARLDAVPHAPSRAPETPA